MRSLSPSRSLSYIILRLSPLPLSRINAGIATAITTTAIIPITSGEKNPPDDEVPVGEKVGYPLPLPFPFPFPLPLPFPFPFPDEPDGVVVGAAVAVPPPVTTKATETDIPELS